jgi:capsular polysaccharide transport system permease protein
MTSSPEPSADLSRRRLRATHDVGYLATPRTIMALILREMTATYGRSPGGYAWAVLEPVAGIAVLTVIFSLALRAPPLGTNFAIFYATGLLPFLMFQSTSTKVAQSLSYSKQLLAYPRVTIIDAILARLILNVMTQLLVSYLVLSGLLLVYDTGTRLVLSSVLLAYAMAILGGACMGILNCFLFSRFSLWKSFWAIINRPLLLVSGVIFLPDMFPRYIRDILLYNPLIHITGEMRSAFYHSYPADYVSPAYVVGVSLVLGVVGLLFLWSYYRDNEEL